MDSCRTLLRKQWLQAGFPRTSQETVPFYRFPIIRMNMLPPLAEIPISATTCLGLDMDLTITSAPDFFANVAAEVLASGGRAVIIVDRPPDAQEHTLAQLAEWGFKTDGIHFLPPIEEAVAACPYRHELGWYGSYLWHKARIADQAGVTCYVDDDSLVRRLFERFLPHVECHYPFELYAREEGAADNTPSGDSRNQSDFQLLHPTPKRQQSAVEVIPFEPVRTYCVTLSGDWEALYRAVTKLDGVVYTNGMIVVPASIDMDHVNELLKTSEQGTFIEKWSETWIGAHA